MSPNNLLYEYVPPHLEAGMRTGRLRPMPMELGIDLIGGLALAAIARPLLFASVDAAVAEAKGVPVRWLSVVFMALLGVAVTMAVPAVGTLLLFALVVTPAATAIMLTPRPAAAMALSTALSVVAVWAGLACSAMFNLPPSFPIVTIVSTIWLVVWVAAQRRSQPVR